jgi:L-cysteine:1D-myo-inositol 2-amino-2-deoxy-alpha-D-glucopyranoside ligase
MVIRTGIIGHHYRTEWSWDDDLMPLSAQRLATWRESTGGYPSDVLEHVRDCLDDDLDTPGAFAAIDDAAMSGHDVTAATALLGIVL